MERMSKSNIIYAAFYAMMESTSDIVFLKDANLEYVAVSMPFVNMVGKENVDEIIGKTDFNIFDDENLAKRYMLDDKNMMETGKDLVDYIEPLPDKDGNARYGSTSKHVLYDTDGKVIGIVGIIRDVTREYFACQRYQQELRYLFELPEDTMAISYIDVDDWRIISQRRQFVENGTVQSCYSVEELAAATAESIVDDTSDAAEFYRNFSQATLSRIYGQGRNNLVYKYQRKLSDGSMRWVHNEIRFLTDVESGNLCAMLTEKDINAEKLEEQNLVVAAKFDMMTMLLNRETSMEYIRQILSHEADGLHALFMIDIDNFKSLNDTLGHQAGDDFLIALATELKSSFRESDVVGRIGGDEFFALMRNVSELSHAERKAQELLNVIDKVCADYPAIHLSASVGIGLFPENGSNLDELYAKADEALYVAKRSGKHQYVFAK